MPQNPYTPTDFDPLVMEQFEGVNTLTTRAGVPDEQMAWCDGFMPISARNLYTMPGLSGAIFTAPPGKTIVKMFFDVSWAIVILSDGSVYAFFISAPALNAQIAGPTTLNVPTVDSCAVVKSGAYLIVVSNQGSGYNIIAPGNPPVFFPAGSVVPGLGAVPVGVFGTTAETYNGHIWVANGPAVVYSAPGSIIDFSGASGGGSFTSTDSFLQSTFGRLIQSNGFLYAIGDHSVNYISGVQTTGTPPTTTFTNQNADPDIGTVWTPAVITWNRNVLIPNLIGVFMLSGGSINKISYELDGIYRTSTFFGTFVPSSAKATISVVGARYAKTVFVMLYPFVDPVSGASVRKLLLWDGKRWWASAQELTLTFIATWAINTTYLAYGTDGTSIYQLFNQPSVGFTKTVRSRYWDRPGGYTHNKSATRFWSLWNYGTLQSPDITVSIDALSVSRSTGASVETTDTHTITGPASTGLFTTPPQAVGQQGVLTGMTISTNAADAQLISAAFAPDVEEYRG